MTIQLRTLLSERVVAYRPVLRKLGVVKTAHGCLLASQLLYFLGKDDEWKWQSITDEQLCGDTGLSVDELRTARKDIVACGYFQVERKGIPARNYYFCNIQKLQLMLVGLVTAENPVIAPVRDVARTRSGLDPNKIGAQPELSICLESKEEEERAPAPRMVRGSANDRIAARTLKVYQEHKPDLWSGKRVLVGPNLDLVKYWIGVLGEEQFYEHLEKALKRARAEKWWSATSLNLEALLRKTKTHLIELSDKYDNLQSKPSSSGAKAYSTNTERPGIPIQKLTIEQIRGQQC